MATPAFADKNQRPTEQSVLTALGGVAPTWQALFSKVRAEHPDLVEAWRYYADGKSWLLKISRKANTVCWVSVEQNAFRVAFYFAERLTDALLGSELSDELKATIRAPLPSGRLRAVRVVFGARRQIRDVMLLIGLKRDLK